MHIQPASTGAATTGTRLDLERFRLDLEIAETTRSRQLAALPESSSDVVAVLHRESVERLLGEIRAARARIEDGSYGVCTDCRGVIPAQRLELRPWAARCTHCGER